MTSQPAYMPEIFEPTSFSYGWAAILWNADPLLTNSTYIGLTTYNNPYLDNDDDHLTVQYQMWYGESANYNPWAWSNHGYGTAAYFATTASVLNHGGDAVAYATFGLRLIDTLNDVNVWFQTSIFDERGNMAEHFYTDIYTGFVSYSSNLDESSYLTLHQDSHTAKHDTFDEDFFRFSISRQQLADFANDLNIHAGYDMVTTEPNWWVLESFMITPELGNAQAMGWLEFEAVNTFHGIESL